MIGYDTVEQRRIGSLAAAGEEAARDKHAERQMQTPGNIKDRAVNDHAEHRYRCQPYFTVTERDGTDQKGKYQTHQIRNRQQTVYHHAGNFRIIRRDICLCDLRDKIHEKNEGKKIDRPEDTFLF